ncbi:MAG: UDP-2,3-diacylglucosamine diphosphatase [Bacteroidota bacterium]
MIAEKSIYIVSDLHLGAPNHEESLKREKHFVQFLREAENDIQELYLLGDIFDFWFEYKRAIPKGFVRILGKLAELSDKGIPIHIFSGNHDLWYKDYLIQEIGAIIHHKPLRRDFFSHSFYLAHGDGLGPGDHGYKFMKRVITHPISKWLFSLLHPDWGIGLALGISGMSRKHQRTVSPYPANEFLGEKEYLLIHSKELLQTEPDISHFVYGHRHILRKFPIQDRATCYFLGDWINFFSYLKISPSEITLTTYPLSERVLSQSSSR